MKRTRVTTAILATAFAGLTTFSFTESNTQQAESEMHSGTMEAEHDHDHASHEVMDENGQATNAEQVLASYMNLKDALVATNKEEAAKAGMQLNAQLAGFDSQSYPADQQADIKDIIADAKEHAEHISGSEMDHQREHFKMLSKDMIDFVAITGTENTLYQQFCPMYDGGSAWLSTSDEIRNPYYGSKMMSCGKVEKEIN